MVSDGDSCPITGGVGPTKPVRSPKAGPGLQQVWLRGDRSCSLSVEVASVSAVATTCGGVKEVSTSYAARFFLVFLRWVGAGRRAPAPLSGTLM